MKRSLLSIITTCWVAVGLTTCADTTVDPTICSGGDIACNGTVSLLCSPDGAGYTVQRDCALDGKICTPTGCSVCLAHRAQCFGDKLLRCNSTGSGFLAKPELICDGEGGEICEGTRCVNACEKAARSRSYVGCEYWPVDLDNAEVRSGNAAAQQFAVALSNPSPLPALVKVYVDRSEVGQPSQSELLMERRVKPETLELLFLPSREVDGSPDGEFNTGTGTALTTNAYRLVSTAPIIAYQFNPLSNAGVFSNDASLLIPTAALSLDAAGKSGASYLVMSWPQTIATTEDPLTNFGDDLRAFLTIVGSRDGTLVTIDLSTDILGGTDIPAKKKGERLELTINAFEVINLETGGYGPDADFTGTRVKASRPVSVYSGSEASDVPMTLDLTTRRCCADHLEQQLFPTSTLGQTFIALKTPSRSRALADAGAQITISDKENEYFRILGAGEFTTVATNLDPPQDQLTLGRGGFQDLKVDRDFTIEGNEPIVVGQFVAGQQEAGIPSSLPGGDPAFILLPPVEQFRDDYLFLTPDKYAFDFLLIAAPVGAQLKFDGRLLRAGCDTESGKKLCCTITRVGKARPTVQRATVEFNAIKCQLSFPKIVPGEKPPKNLEAGSQNDGVHRLRSTVPVGLVVYGFDAYVSYGYPGGTDLSLINIK